MARPVSVSSTQVVADPPSGPSADPPDRHDKSLRRLVVALGIGVVVASLFVYLAVRFREQQSATALRVTGIPSTVPTALADLMGLSPVPNRTAPDFTLTDQNGQSMSLTGFRGKAVVLEFMDPHCTDICPIVSQEFVDAYHDLGADASHVAFLAVNVNQYYAGVGDMAAYSHEHGLGSIPSWHFLTGSTDALRAVWQAYGVQVEAPNPNADIVHTSVVYFIDPKGQMRYLGVPMDDHTPSGTAYLPASPLAQWGQGIALVSGRLSG
jgi:protein SCO1